MKKTLFFIMCILFSFFAFAKTETKTMNEVTEIIDCPNLTKESIFEKVNLWATKTFVSAESVIDYSDKESGTISAKFITEKSYVGNKGNYVSNQRYLVIINVKESKLRIKISMPEVKLKGGYAVSSKWQQSTDKDYKKADFSNEAQKLVESLKSEIYLQEDIW